MDLQHKISIKRGDGDLFFRQWREYVIAHCANPGRRNCLSPDELRGLVFSPDEVDAGDIVFVHIVGCAECARDLDELMRIRNAELTRRHPALPLASRRWIGLASTLALTAAVVLGACFLARQNTRRRDAPVAATIETIDLGPEGVPRGYERSAPTHYTLPRKMVDLRLILPYFSPPGNYTISISENANGNAVEVRKTTVVTSLNGHPELAMALDLRSIKPGHYWLITFHDGDSAISCYSLDVR